jgi:hypothetical protein
MTASRDVEAKSKKGVASEICNQLKKVFGLLRFYEEGHALLQDAILQLHDQVDAYLAQNDDLELTVSSLALSLGEEVAYKAQRADESITRPLFLDGIQSLVIGKNVGREELSAFLRMWNSAFDLKPDGLRSFATDFWEADFPHLRVMSIETFSEGVDDDDAKRKNDEITRLLAQVSSDPLSSGDGGIQRPIRISRLDLAVLTSQGVSELSARDLERRDRRSDAPIARPPEDAISMLGAALSSPDEAPLLRAFLCLHALVEEAPSVEAAEIADLIQRLAQSFVTEKRIAELDRAIQAVPKDEASPIMAALPDAIAATAVLDGLVASIADAQIADAVVRVLELLPESAAPALIDRLATIKAPDGRARLAQCIAALRPPIEVLKERIASATAEIVEPIMAIARARGEDVANEVRRAGLASPDQAVRKTLFQTMTKKEILAGREDLYALLGGPDSDIRSAILHALVTAKDPGCIPILDRVLKEKTVDVDDRKAIVSALGVLGGAMVAQIVRREVETEKDPDALATAIRALAKADPDGARPVIEAVQKRWFVRAQVRTACEEALRRIATKRSTSDLTAPPIPTVDLRPPEPTPRRQSEPPEPRRPSRPIELTPPSNAAQPRPPDHRPRSAPVTIDERPSKNERTKAAERGSSGTRQGGSEDIVERSKWVDPRSEGAVTSATRRASAPIERQQEPACLDDSPPPTRNMRPPHARAGANDTGVLTRLTREGAQLECANGAALGARLVITVESSQGPYLTLSATVSHAGAHGPAEIVFDPLTDEQNRNLARIARPTARIPVRLGLEPRATAARAESKTATLDLIYKSYVDSEDDPA